MVKNKYGNSWLNVIKTFSIVCMMTIGIMFSIVDGNISLCSASEPDFPAKPSSNIYVSDNAGIIDEEAENIIYSAGKDLDNKYGAQLVVVTINSLDGEDIDSYTNTLFRKWGIGNREKNNGVLMVIAKDDRKFRIEVGYGLEGAITDGYSGTVLDGMKSYFRNEEYSQGIVEDYGKLADKVYGEYGSTMPEEIQTKLKTVSSVSAINENEVTEEEEEWWEMPVLILVIIAFIAFFLWVLWQSLWLIVMYFDLVLGIFGIHWLSGLSERLTPVGMGRNNDSYSSYSSDSSSDSSDYGGGSSGGGGSSDSW